MVPPAASLDGVERASAPVIQEGEASTDAMAWLGQMTANQYRATNNCSRYLLLEDDLDSAGLGWTAHMLVNVLWIAMRQDRVLLEVPLNASWRHAGKAHSNWHKKSHVADPDGKRPRWCDRAPWTLQCLYQPWTSCPAPTTAVRVYTPGLNEKNDIPLTRVFNTKRYRRAPIVRLKLSWIAASGSTWLSGRGRQTPAQFAANVRQQAAKYQAGVHLLFRPRAWIAHLGRCILESAQLMQRPEGFIAVHVRASAEKAAEVKKRQGADLPGIADYYELTRMFARRLGQPKVFLQTSSPGSVSGFAQLADRDGLELSFTNNTRSEHDSWGGWSPTGQMESALVGAVNLHVPSSHASVFISLHLSAWTDLVGARGWHGGTHYKLCCASKPSALAWWRACKLPTISVFVRRGVALNVSDVLDSVPQSQRRCLLWKHYRSLYHLQRQAHFPALGSGTGQ